MANVKMISVSYERKLNLGDYNSAKVEVALWVDVEEGDDEAAIAANMRQMARNNVLDEMARLIPSLAPKAEHLFMGLPVEENDDAD